MVRSAARGVSDSVIPLSTSQLMRRHLAAIRFALPFDAGQIVVFDRARDRHHQMAQIGYPPEVARVMSEEFPLSWPRPAWRPVERGDDLPPTVASEQDGPWAFRQSAIYRDHLAVAGFRDGLTLELNHRGRYVGLANFSSRAEGFYTTDLRRASQAFASLLGHAINATAQDLESVPQSARATVLHQSGTASPLAGRPRGQLADQADFQAVIQPVFDASPAEVAFLWRSAGQWFRVVVRRQLGESSADQQSLVVIEQPIERPHGLTPAEIRVLTRLVTCSSNEEIARSLGVGIRTVHTHISNILAKLDCQRRTQAVASAIRNGIFLPEPGGYTSLTHLVR